MIIKKQPFHAPVHFFVDEASYFITSAIYQRRHLLTPDLKSQLLTILQQEFQKYRWQLHHWVILNNHYHILGVSDQGADLSRLMQSIHSKSAVFISQVTHCEKPVWWNFWDYCPRNEIEYLTRLNYLWMNPIKHGYVTDLKAYPGSSFQVALENLGQENLIKQFREYPYQKVAAEIYDDF